MKPVAALILPLAMLGACKGQVLVDDDEPRFPEPDRAVSDLGSNQFSTEDQRDSRGEAKTVMDLAEIEAAWRPFPRAGRAPILTEHHGRFSSSAGR